MNKSSMTPSSDSSDNSFKTLAEVTTKLSQGRSDAVAIAGIVGLVIAFMTLIIVGGLVFAASQTSNHNSQPETNSLQQKKP